MDRSDHPYRAVGSRWFGHLKTIGGVRPDDRVLDVGCGCGRMAVPFLNYMSDIGGYWGFDVSRDGIAWCNRRIAS